MNTAQAHSAEAALAALSDGWTWRYITQRGVAHAKVSKSKTHKLTACGRLASDWVRAAPTPETASKQYTTSVFCQLCVGRIVRSHQRTLGVAN